MQGDDEDPVFGLSEWIVEERSWILGKAKSSEERSGCNLFAQVKAEGAEMLSKV